MIMDFTTFLEKKKEEKESTLYSALGKTQLNTPTGLSPVAQLREGGGEAEGALRECTTQRGKQISVKPCPLNPTGGPAQSPLLLRGGPPASW